MVCEESILTMTLLSENATRFEFCRLCYELKNSFVNMFETVIFKEGCLLVDKLKDLYGVQASAGDEMSTFVCVDCLRDIKFQGNITYGLWSTLDYLLRMHEEKQMEAKAFNIPKESLDFLISEKKEHFTKSIALPNDFDLSETPVMECSKNNGLDCVQSELEEPVEYCWCSECNAEFLNKGELRVHLKMHENFESKNYLNEATDSAVSNEEYKLISGERSLLKSRLCCSKCQKEFSSEKRLVKHIKKHDFKCKPRNFESLNSFLKSLKSNSPEDNTLLNNQDYNSSFPIDSNIHNSKGSTACGSFDIVNYGKTRFLLPENARKIDAGTLCHVKTTVDCTKVSPIVISPKNSRVSNSYVGTHPSSSHSSMQGICSFNNPFMECDNDQKDKEILGMCMVSTHDSCEPDAINKVEVENTIFGNVMSVNGGIMICDYCGRSYSFKFKLREHIVMCHLSIIVHKCLTCCNVFPSESELRTHSDKHTSMSKYICSLCDDNFTSRPNMALHFKNVHGISKEKTCSVCFLGFPSLVELRFHQLCHSYNKKYKCSKCGKAYLNRSYYNSHVRFCQLRTLGYQCRICEKKFIRKQDLEVHSYTHSSDKRFPCHLCPKQFRQIGQRDIHISCVHLKLKPHECGICKRKFSTRKCLMRHYAVHSDDRPFSCDLCGKTFKLKYQVCIHRKKVHGDY